MAWPRNRRLPSSTTRATARQLGRGGERGRLRGLRSGQLDDGDRRQPDLRLGSRIGMPCRGSSSPPTRLPSQPPGPTLSPSTPAPTLSRISRRLIRLAASFENGGPGTPRHPSRCCGASRRSDPRPHSCWLGLCSGPGKRPSMETVRLQGPRSERTLPRWPSLRRGRHPMIGRTPTHRRTLRAALPLPPPREALVS